VFRTREDVLATIGRIDVVGHCEICVLGEYWFRVVRGWVEEVSVDGAAQRFLGELGRRGREPLWGGVRGRAQLELVDGSRTDRWLIVIDRGSVAVSHGGGDADCTVRGEQQLFDRLCRGEANAMAAVLRGELLCTGDVELLFAIQRVFPGPSREVNDRSGEMAD
jgi:putative sterol carrier protein